MADNNATVCTSEKTTWATASINEVDMIARNARRDAACEVGLNWDAPHHIRDTTRHQHKNANRESARLLSANSLDD